MEIDELALRVGVLGDEVAAVAPALARSDPGPTAFAGDAAGRIGELGRALHGRYAAALTARQRESAAVGARLTDLAGALRAAAAGYREVEDAAHRRHRGSGGT